MVEPLADPLLEAVAEALALAVAKFVVELETVLDVLPEGALDSEGLGDELTEPLGEAVALLAAVPLTVALPEEVLELVAEPLTVFVCDVETVLLTLIVAL